MLSDSGAVYHVAPPSFASDTTLEPPPTHLGLRAASHGPLEIIGLRKVKLRFPGVSGVARSNFIICRSVRIVELSVPVLAASEHEVIFKRRTCRIEIDHGIIEGTRVGRRYEVYAEVLPEHTVSQLVAPLADLNPGNAAAFRNSRDTFSGSTSDTSSGSVVAKLFDAFVRPSARGTLGAGMAACGARSGSPGGDTGGF